MSCTQESIHELVEKQRRFFRTGATLPVEWRLEQLKKLKAAVIEHQAALEAALYEDLRKSPFEAYLVEIGPVISIRTFHGVRIELKDMEEGYTGSLSVRSADVDLEGELLKLKELKLSDIHLYVDASDLGEGVYELPVQCSVSKEDESGWMSMASPETVTLTIKAK